MRTPGSEARFLTRFHVRASRALPGTFSSDEKRARHAPPHASFSPPRSVNGDVKGTWIVTSNGRAVSNDFGTERLAAKNTHLAQISFEGAITGNRAPENLVGIAFPETCMGQTLPFRENSAMTL